MAVQLCAVCGKKNGLMENHRQLADDPGLKEYLLCQNCYAKAYKIKIGKYDDIDIDYFNGYFASGSVKMPVQDFLMSIINNTLDYERASDEMLLNTGFSFEGYRIAKYLGFLEFQTAMGMGYFKTLDASIATLTGSEAIGFQDKISHANKQVINGIKKQASQRGANAISGLVLRHSMFASNLIAIVATGTAVKIEPIE